jgi:hypothetical protein
MAPATDLPQDPKDGAAVTEWYCGGETSWKFRQNPLADRPGDEYCGGKESGRFAAASDHASITRWSDNDCG